MRNHGRQYDPLTGSYIRGLSSDRSFGLAIENLHHRFIGRSVLAESLPGDESEKSQRAIFVIGQGLACDRPLGVFDEFFNRVF